jgi:hypothetical protein
MESVADETVPAAVDCQLRSSLRSKTLAASLEPQAEIASVESVSTRILVLRTHKASIVAGPLFTTKAFPLSQIVEGAPIPG